MSINNKVLKHTQARLFIYCACFCTTVAELSSCDRPLGLWSLRYLVFWPFTGKFADPDTLHRWSAVLHRGKIYIPKKMIEGRRKRGRQRMRWLDSIIDSLDMSKLGDSVGQGSLVCCIHGVTESWTRLSNWTTTTTERWLAKPGSWWLPGYFWMLAEGSFSLEGYFDE